MPALFNLIHNSPQLETLHAVSSLGLRANPVEMTRHQVTENTRATARLSASKPLTAYRSLREPRLDARRSVHVQQLE